MIRFDCDYTEGAHPLILDALVNTNMEQTCGYGLDKHCENARKLIQKACDNDTIDVHFLVGGTQTNTIVINSILKPYQGVLSADTGHINVHETGAIEATGHKVLPLENHDGKISAAQVKQAYSNHINDANHEHTVQPGMIYISYPTETGTLYSKQELKELHQVAKQYHLPLFIDGARLGYGLVSEACDITLKDLCELSDVFYIGGTKVGALLGEAVIISNPQLKNGFRYMIKRHGGLLAKGRLLGIQFETLFSHNLYFDISKHAINMAMKLKNAMIELGYPLYCQSYTNQQFIILPNSILEQLKEQFAFSFWLKQDENHSAVRFCTSWATKEENIDKLVAALKAFQ